MHCGNHTVIENCVLELNFSKKQKSIPAICCKFENTELPTDHNKGVKKWKRSVLNISSWNKNTYFYKRWICRTLLFFFCSSFVVFVLLFNFSFTTFICIFNLVKNDNIITSLFKQVRNRSTLDCNRPAQNLIPL